VPCAGRAEGTGGAERILQELDVTDLVTPHPREQRERRGDLFAERARFVRKAPERRDAVFIGDDVSDLERLCLPDPADAVEDIDDAVISTGSNRAGGWSVKPSAMWSWSGSPAS
jgi:hypothetical protein